MTNIDPKAKKSTLSPDLKAKLIRQAKEQQNKLVSPLEVSLEDNITSIDPYSSKYEELTDQTQTNQNLQTPVNPEIKLNNTINKTVKDNIKLTSPLIPEVSENITDPETAKKTNRNNQYFFIITGILILILAISLIVIGFLKYQSDQTSNNNQSLNSSQESATNSAINNSTSSKSESSSINNILSFNEFQQKYFFTKLDSNGLCSDLAVCAEISDPDNDGLINSDENIYQTDPLKPDSDIDNISDGDEIAIYSSNPISDDSNENGVKDFEEIRNCYDPAVKTNSKLTNSKKSLYSQNIKLYKLHEPTIASLKNSQATETDLLNGFISANCSGVVIVK
jgi:Bacterial TSP3 repeat